MSTKKVALKRGRELSSLRSVDNLPEVGLAAVTSSRRQKDVGEFIDYLLRSLERNTSWLNNIVSRQNSFRCALMTGAGPNRFHIQEILYPLSPDKKIKLEVELKESEDLDKVAIVALLKMSNADLMHLLDFIKYRLYENPMLKDDMLKGKGMGISFAVLKPFAEKQYRVMERIVIGNNSKGLNPPQKKREEKSRPPVKRIKQAA